MPDQSKDAPQKTGRPTKFDKRYCELATRARLLGYTNRQLADILGVTESTLYKWMAENSEFSDAAREGGDYADAIVAESLFFQAVGYEYKGKYHPPSPGVGQFWLSNRQRAKWRNRQEVINISQDEQLVLDEYRRRKQLSEEELEAEIENLSELRDKDVTPP